MDDINTFGFRYISSKLTKTCPHCFTMFTQKSALNRHTKQSCSALGLGVGKGNRKRKPETQSNTSDSSSNESDSMSVVSNLVILK